MCSQPPLPAYSNSSPSSVSECVTMSSSSASSSSSVFREESPSVKSEYLGDIYSSSCERLNGSDNETSRLPWLPQHSDSTTTTVLLSTNIPRMTTADDPQLNHSPSTSSEHPTEQSSFYKHNSCATLNSTSASSSIGHHLRTDNTMLHTPQIGPTAARSDSNSSSHCVTQRMALRLCSCRDCLSVTEMYSPKLQVSRTASSIITPRGSVHTSYIVRGKLGQGTWGTVHLAIERESGFERAIKKIPKKFGSAELSRFRQEMSILRDFDHPRIARLYETFEDHANIYMILEYLKGGELFERICQESYFPEVVAACLAKQMFSAVHYCHSRDVCHRDLKPENFLFSDKDIRTPLKLVDFGLARRARSLESMNTVAGSVYYVAPEVLRGHYTRTCDQWSCGVILYIMLCGVPPFKGDSDSKISLRIMSGEVQFEENIWSRISPQAKDLISKLCNPSSTKRISFRDALNHDWFKMVFPSPFMQLQTLQLNEVNLKSLNNKEEVQQTTPLTLNKELIESLIIAGTKQQSDKPVAPCNSSCCFLPFCCDIQNLCISDHSNSCMNMLEGEKRVVGGPSVYQDNENGEAMSLSCPVPCQTTGQQVAQQALLRVGISDAQDAFKLGFALLQKFRQFAKMNPVKRAILSIMAQQLEQSKEMVYVRSIFDLLDADGDGIISKDELSSGILQLFNLSAADDGDDSEDIISDEDATTPPNGGGCASTSTLGGPVSSVEDMVHMICGDDVLSPSGDGGSENQCFPPPSNTWKLVNLRGRVADTLSAEIFHLSDFLDMDGNNQIDYSEFIAACLETASYAKLPACKAAFRVLDLDGDGLISQNELKYTFGWSPRQSESDFNCISPSTASTTAPPPVPHILQTEQRPSTCLTSGSIEGLSYSIRSSFMKRRSTHFKKVTSASVNPPGGGGQESESESHETLMSVELVKRIPHTWQGTPHQSCCINNNNSVESLILTHKRQTVCPASRQSSEGGMENDDWCSDESVSGSSRNMDMALQSVSQHEWAEEILQDAWCSADEDADGYLCLQEFRNLLLEQPSDSSAVVSAVSSYSSLAAPEMNDYLKTVNSANKLSAKLYDAAMFDNSSKRNNLAPCFENNHSSNNMFDSFKFSNRSTTTEPHPTLSNITSTPSAETDYAAAYEADMKELKKLEAERIRAFIREQTRREILRTE